MTFLTFKTAAFLATVVRGATVQGSPSPCPVQGSPSPPPPIQRRKLPQAGFKPVIKFVVFALDETLCLFQIIHKLRYPSHNLPIPDFGELSMQNLVCALWRHYRAVLNLLRYLNLSEFHAYGVVANTKSVKPEDGNLWLDDKAIKDTVAEYEGTLLSFVQAVRK